MLRRLIIATGTLGLILVGFGIYRSHNTPTEKPMPSLPEVTVATASAPASQEAVTWARDLRIAPGKGASFEVFDQKGQLQYLMKAAEWKATNKNELDLEKPELWKYMRNGQVLRITADSGQILVEPAGENNVKPKRGWLRQNVRISIDLSTRAWRDAHPGRDAIEQHPEHVLAIEMDSLYFDEDLSLIRTDESVRVRSSRFDITSTGLKMIYSRPMDRLEHLVLVKDGTIVLRGDLDMGQQSGGKAPMVRPAATQAQASAPASRATSTASAPASQAEPAKYQDIYRAVFEGPVNVQQYREDKVVARLDRVKVLELLFDMMQKERQGDEEPAGPLPAMGPAPQTADADTGERTVLTWAGSLEITPVEPRTPLEQAVRTTRIRAVGDNVTLEDVEAGNTITCQQLDYDIVQRSGRIAATAPAMARLVDSRGGYLAGQDIRFDQTERTLTIDGPGEAAEPESVGGMAALATPGSEEASKIRWTESLLVQFQPAEIPMPLSVIPLNMPTRSAVMERLNRQSIFQMRAPARRIASLAGNPLQGLAARSAVIAGEAQVQRGSETLRAGRLAIDFFAATKGKTFGAIQAAVGEDKVELVSKDQVIEADSLDVRFVPAEGGRSVPNHAIAQGHAVARQDTAKIAADFLDATLAQVPVAGEGEAEGRTRPAVVMVTATGNVHIQDPQQEMDLRGDALTAEIPDGRQVKNLTVKGTADAPAQVTMRDYALVGPTIQADLQAQDVVLPSAGRLELLVRQGPEGTRLDKPRPLVITWADRMQMWGGRNEAVFEGNVQATMDSRKESGQAILAGQEKSDEDTAVTADQMTVYFRTAAAANDSQPATEPSPALQVLEKAREQIAQVMPAAAEWLPGPRQRSRTPRLGNDAAMQREPIRVIAKGHAKAISSRYDADRTILTSRLFIEGPTFEADLARQELRVPGAGKLLLENYALVKTAARLVAAGVNLATQPIEKAPEDSLSQTVFAWTNGMTFMLEDQMSIFDGGVNMVHRSGSKVVLGMQLSQALKANASLLQGMPGSIATLSSDNLVVQFSETDDQKARQEATRDQWLRRAELENMVATGNVYMHQELSNGGSRFLTAGRVQYSGQRETFVIQGTPGAQGSRGGPANLVRQKDAQSAPQSTTLDSFWWNVKTDEVSAKGIRGQGIQ
jgi:hypothetical protein